jgi:hypothetical protein
LSAAAAVVASGSEMSSASSPFSSCTYAKARSSAGEAATGADPTALTLPPYATPANSTTATQTMKATHSRSTAHSAADRQTAAKEGPRADARADLLAADEAAARADRGDGGGGEADIQSPHSRERHWRARPAFGACVFEMCTKFFSLFFSFFFFSSLSQADCQCHSVALQ